MRVATTAANGMVQRVELVPTLEMAAELFGPGPWHEVPRGTGIGWFLSPDGTVAPWSVDSNNCIWVLLSEWQQVDVETQWSYLEVTGLDAANSGDYLVLGGAGRAITDADLAALVEILP